MRMRFTCTIPLLLVPAVFGGCYLDSSAPTADEPAAADETTMANSSELLSGPVFTEVAAWGLENVQAQRIATADVNGDKLPDLLTFAPDGSYRMFINRGAGSTPYFEDVTDWSGIKASRRGTMDRMSSFGIFGDVDNDGDVDLFVARYVHRYYQRDPAFDADRNDLLLNDGSGRFTLATSSPFHLERLWNTAAATFVDYDNDGLLDLYIGNWYSDVREIGNEDQLYRGIGGGDFINMTANMGLLAVTPYMRYGVAAADVNNDGKMDLFANNYGMAPSVHFRNDGTKFTAVTTSHFGDNVGPHWSSDMSRLYRHTCSWGTLPRDFDNDGDIDFFELLVHGGEYSSTNQIALRSGLLVNNGSGTFTSKMFLKAVRTSDTNQDEDNDHHMAWTDLDNDGLADVILTEASPEIDNSAIYVFQQKTDHTFAEVTASSGLSGVNTDARSPCAHPDADGKCSGPHNVLPIDFDNDGDMDLVVGFATKHPLRFFRNDYAKRGNWLRVAVQGSGNLAQSATDAIGARVSVVAGGRTYTQEVGGGSGHFGPQGERTLHFGLGTATSAKVTVKWRNIQKTSTAVSYSTVNKTVTVTEPATTVCAGGSGVWSACRGSGCLVCQDKVENYPLYFKNHPACRTNPSCQGSYYTCSSQCPAPSGSDSCPATSGQWKGCMNNGCNVCATLLVDYPRYFDNHPYCIPNYTYQCVANAPTTCNSNCPAPTALDTATGWPPGTGP
jgi:enediyne biosynthesis protein E4